jgi:uncharacterized membrane protein HdeD (DUF308 family)
VTAMRKVPEENSQEGALNVYFQTNSAEVFRGRRLVVLLRGLVAVAFGVLAIAGPRMVLSKLILLFGIYALLHGVLSVAAAIGSRHQPGCILLGIEGLVALWAGGMTLWTSNPAPMAFVFLVWLWAVATGLLKIAEAIRLRKELPGSIWLALSGVVTLFLGFMLFSHRIIGGIAGLALLIAIPAMVWGVFEILEGWQLRTTRHSTKRAI